MTRDQIRDDAKGAFAPSQADRTNNGVASAKPRVITGSDDATANKWPPGTSRPPKDWDLNFDPAQTPERPKATPKAE